MSHKLLTILGKVRSDNGGDYRDATYNFNGQQKKSKYFGLALKDIVQPDEMIIIGTHGSMWDNFFIELGIDDEQILELTEQAQQNNIDEKLLSKLFQLAEEKLNIPINFCLITYAQNEREQIDFIYQITNLFQSGDQATLDITHGLRHLPLLVQHVINLLPALKNTQVKGLYYGALELTTDHITPVMRLDGLNTITEWQYVLSEYDKTANIALFCPLLAKIGVSKSTVKHLQNAAFFQQTHNLFKAKKSIITFLGEMKNQDIDNNLVSLISPVLENKLKWTKENTFWKQHFEWSSNALESRDYLRCALYAYEAFLERVCEHEGEYNADIDLAQEIMKKYLKKDKDQCDKKNINNAYHEIRQVRNLLAHGDNNKSKLSKNVQSAISNEDKLIKLLGYKLDILKNCELS